MRITNREIVRIPSDSIEYYIPKHLIDNTTFVKSGVILAGYSKLTKGYFVNRPKNKGFHVLFATLSGYGEVFLEDGGKLLLKSGDVFFSNAFGQGTVVTKATDGTWETCWLHVLPSFEWFSPPSEDHTIFSCDFLTKIRDILVSIMDEEMRGDVQGLSIQKKYCELFILYVSRLLDHQRKGLDLCFQAKMNQALSSLMTSSRQPWTQDVLARKVGMSRSQIYRNCKANYNLSPGVMIRRMNMENAMFLLQYTKTSIADISESVGYASQAAFSHAFSQFYGLSPREIRKNQNSSRKPNTYMDTQQYIIGDSAINQVVPLFRTNWEHSHIPLLVSFRKEWGSIGVRVQNAFNKVGLSSDYLILEPNDSGYFEKVKEIKEQSSNEILLIAIGDEFLSDKIKMIASRLHVTLMILALSPSSPLYATSFYMDAQRFPINCEGPTIIIGDTTIMKEHRTGLLMGFLETLSTVTSGIDWLYDCVVTGRDYTPAAWSYAQSNPDELANILSSIDAEKILFQRLIHIGFATQIEHSPIPMLGSEHQIYYLLLKIFPESQKEGLLAFSILLMLRFQHALKESNSIDERLQEAVAKRMYLEDYVMKTVRLNQIQFPAFSEADVLFFHSSIRDCCDGYRYHTLLELLNGQKQFDLMLSCFQDVMDIAHNTH